MPRLASNRLIHQLQRKTKTAFYGDVVTYYATPSAENGLDKYGQPTAATSGTDIDCSFNDKPSRERWGKSMDIQGIAGEVRFDGVTPDKGGRIKVTMRWDEADTIPHIYEIVDIRQRGEFGYECLLKAVKI